MGRPIILKGDEQRHKIKMHKGAGYRVLTTANTLRFVQGALNRTSTSPIAQVLVGGKILVQAAYQTPQANHSEA